MESSEYTGKIVFGFILMLGSFAFCMLVAKSFHKTAAQHLTVEELNMPELDPNEFRFAIEHYPGRVEYYDSNIMFVKPTTVITTFPLPDIKSFFFELLLLNVPPKSRILLALVPSIDSASALSPNAVALDILAGSVLIGGAPIDWLATSEFQEGDVIGCYIKLKPTSTIAFLRNGVASESVKLPPGENRYPVLYATSGCHIYANFGFLDFLYPPAPDRYSKPPPAYSDTTIQINIHQC